MEKRFKVALQSDATVAWSDIFDDGHTMASRQSKYNFMKDRTFLRPRDMIKFCNETLAEFKNDLSRGDKFENTHILTAEPK
jgi:hypothetical protein